jgi:hypothetical protein
MVLASCLASQSAGKGCRRVWPAILSRIVWMGQDIPFSGTERGGTRIWRIRMDFAEFLLAMSALEK